MDNKIERRNTIQKELVLDAVTSLNGHVTADEIYAFISSKHPSIGKGTVYRNLSVLEEEHRIRKVEIPDGPDCYDFTLKEHYHVKCVKCGRVFDVDMEKIDVLREKIRDTHGFYFLDYDILFKGICPDCRKTEDMEKEQ